MTMTPSQALRAPRIPATRGRQAPGFDETSWPIADTSMGQRLAVALLGSIIALGTRPIEALGGIDGDPEDAEPTGERPDHSAATAA
jgi:hypothetical protein